jgi:hypothetical protein
MNRYLTYVEDEVGPCPFKWEVCDECGGSGVSSAYLGSFTRDELDDAGEEFAEDYFAGRYDRKCPECDGLRVVKGYDYDAMTAEQRERYDEALGAYNEELANRRVWAR